ncbi:MAG: methionine synthase [Nocardioidaceae bacterium]
MPLDHRLPTGVATGVGSMPGEDFASAVSVVLGELSDLIYLPELPQRGQAATMNGRGVALLVGLGADLQPAGWRLADAPGADQTRARSLLAHDLDSWQEHAQSHPGAAKLQVVGPWTLAATTELPKGDKVVGDIGARRDLAQSLAEGVRLHIRDARRRLPDKTLVVQIDEPALPAVIKGQVPTASGFHRHRSVDAAAAAQGLEWVLAEVSAEGAAAVVHCCAGDLPIRVLRSAGSPAISFDLSLVRAAQLDSFAEAVQDGVAMLVGVVPGADPGMPVSDVELTSQVAHWWQSMGFAAHELGDHCLITPTCGLAGASPSWARRSHQLAVAVARNVSAAGQD